MSYEIDKVSREIEQKLKKYNEHLAWLQADRESKQEALNLKLKGDSENAIAPEATPAPNIMELTPEEFFERYAKDGQSFLNKRLNELAKLYPEKPPIDIDPKRLEMLKAFRIGTSIDQIIAQFSN